jgi:hypothetical protein
MKSLLITLCCIPLNIYAQQENFNTKKYEFHYRAVYINPNGDTITDELLVLKPLGRPWIAQLFKQKSIKYIYHTDTTGIKKYFDPRKRDNYKNSDQNSKPIKTEPKEITGLIYNENEYYIHPPRSNQYEMLFYSSHPQVIMNKLNDSTDQFKRVLVVPTWGRLNTQFTVAPIRKWSTFDNVKLWSVFGKSKWNFKKPKPYYNIYNSEFIAAFSKEYGFTKMHYHFEDGTKILFDLIDIKKP